MSSVPIPTPRGTATNTPAARTSASTVCARVVIGWRIGRVRMQPCATANPALPTGVHITAAPPMTDAPQRPHPTHCEAHDDARPLGIQPRVAERDQREVPAPIPRLPRRPVQQPPPRRGGALGQRAGARAAAAAVGVREVGRDVQGLGGGRLRVGQEGVVRAVVGGRAGGVGRRGEPDEAAAGRVRVAHRGWGCARLLRVERGRATRPRRRRCCETPTTPREGGVRGALERLLKAPARYDGVEVRGTGIQCCK